jgi:hypothetical protein
MFPFSSSPLTFHVQQTFHASSKSANPDIETPLRRAETGLASPLEPFWRVIMTKQRHGYDQNTAKVT